MAMNNSRSLRVLVDIETVPIENAVEFLDLSDISAPSNYKDEIKIKAYVEAEQQKVLNKAALDLDLCRIVAVGWLVEDEDDPDVCVCRDEAMEQAVLERFWAELDERTTVGYNQVGFDLPILARRSLYLGVTAPMLNLDKYRTPHLDLQQRLSLNGTKPYRSLNWYAKRFGLDVPADLHSGKDIGQLVTDGHWEAIEAHCKADVLKTKALAQRMGLLKQQPQMQEAAF